MKIIEVTGTDYEMGYKIGKYFKNYLNSVIEKNDNVIKDESIYKKEEYLWQMYL